MKIYTVQKENWIKDVTNSGIIIPNSYKKRLSLEDRGWTDYYKNAYLWMDKEYKKRINQPILSELIWISLSPWLFNRTKKNENYLQYTFEIPKKELLTDILWSDYFDWHYILNYCDNWENHFEIFDINIFKPNKNQLPQGVTSVLNMNYLKSITKSNESKYYD